MSGYAMILLILYSFPLRIIIAVASSGKPDGSGERYRFALSIQYHFYHMPNNLCQHLIHHIKLDQIVFPC